MMNGWVDLHAISQILIFGVLFGAGLPMVFALGLRALGMGSAQSADDQSEQVQIIGGSRIGMVLGGICFAVILAAVATGIYTIVSHR